MTARASAWFTSVLLGCAPALTATFTARAALAQTNPATVEAIVVTAGRNDSSVTETRHAVSAEEAQRSSPSSAADIVRLLPSAHVPVNSRGEALIFLRNAGERQVAVFLDGALLNVPWDNRIDLAMVPANIVGSASLASGPISAQYGVNALGAVNLAPRTFESAGGEGRLQVGEGGERLVEALGVAVVGDVQITGSAGYSERSGETLARDPDLPFSQDSGRLRTNTDRELLGLAGRLGWEAGPGEAGLTLLHVEGKKGVAPEGDRATGARFWRYPDLRNDMAILRADMVLGETQVHAAAWGQVFEQTIDAYASADFDRLAMREEDWDRTAAARFVVTRPVGSASLALSTNVLRSTHDQRDTAFDADGTPPAVRPDKLRFRQRAVSVGADLQQTFGDLTVEVGAGYDWLSFPLTGDKPAIDGFEGSVLRAGGVWAVGDEWTLRAAAGAKSRMPTMRDLFGAALNRFLLNPDLQPERVATAELGVGWRGRSAAFQITPFLQRVDNTLDQRNVGRLRQRVNLRGSKVEGLEAEGEAEFGHWRARAQGTFTHTRRRRMTPEEPPHIAEKPAVLARATVGYIDPEGPEVQAELEHIGKAWSADVDGLLRPLDASTQLHLRFAYNLTAAGRPGLNAYLRIDNVTDAHVPLQLGLPGPGRTVRTGVRAPF